MHTFWDRWDKYRKGEITMVDLYGAGDLIREYRQRQRLLNQKHPRYSFRLRKTKIFYNDKVYEMLTRKELRLVVRAGIKK